MKKWLAVSIAINVALATALAATATREPRRHGVRAGERRVSQFELFQGRRGGVVFLGDSLTQGGLWDELFPGVDVRNRGVDGDTTGTALARIHQVHALAPRKLFVMLGINDLNLRVPLAQTAAHLEDLFDGFDRALPSTRIHVQSVLPVNDAWIFEIEPAAMDALNAELARQSRERGYVFVDLRPAFADAEGRLRRDLSNDGLHLTGAGYAVWRQSIRDLVIEREAGPR